VDLSINQKFLRKQEKATLANTAYLKIKEAIINNEFKPGEILSENMLAEMLDMSRTPIRDALKELKRDDLVHLVPGVGIFVKEVSEKELRDVFDVRISLECLAAQTAPQFFDNSEIAQLVNQWTALDRGSNKDGWIEWKKISKLDYQLHNMIVQKSHNVCLIHVYQSLQPKLMRYQLLVIQFWGNTQNTIKQHIEILNTIENKNIEELKKILEIHLRSAVDNLVEKLGTAF